MATELTYLDIDTYVTFPPAEQATGEGIVAVGGNLSPGMLLSAYRQGIFPWYSEGEPILWWSPDPRFVLNPAEYHLSRSTVRFLRKRPFRFTIDTAFPDVVRACKDTARPGQDGTWITLEMEAAYVSLHEVGFAHSVEVWSESTLVGGLYGVSIGAMFAGESMFSRVDNASKAALAVLTTELAQRGATLLDCQVHTDHLAAAGARHLSRRRFLSQLKRSLADSRLDDLWRGDTPLGAALETMLGLGSASS